MSSSPSTFTFNFSGNDELDFEEQCVHYQNQWAEIFKYQPWLNDVDCIVIQTGYTDRIIESKSMLAKLHPAAVVSKSAMTPYVKNELLYKLTQLCKIADDYVVFNKSFAIKALELVEKLRRLDYCGCCNITNVYKATWHTFENDVVVLTVEVDCESG